MRGRLCTWANSVMQNITRQSFKFTELGKSEANKMKSDCTCWFVFVGSNVDNVMESWVMLVFTVFLFPPPLWWRYMLGYSWLFSHYILLVFCIWSYFFLFRSIWWMHNATCSVISNFNVDNAVSTVKHSGCNNILHQKHRIYIILLILCGNVY